MKRIYVAALCCALAFAQEPPAKTRFEVASIKPTAPGTSFERFERQHIRIDASRVSFGSISARQLIQKAYGVVQFQVIGPDWLGEPQFDVEAALPAGSSQDDVSAMLRTLLEERFKLVVHREQKVTAAYAMAVAKDGPKFHESAADDSSIVLCNGNFHHICHKVTMDMLATTLSRVSRLGAERLNPAEIDRPVVNMTGLAGSFDFTMDYGYPTGRPAPDDPSATSLDMVTAFDAVKALGLKLEPTTHTDELLIIDHIDRVPTEN